MALSLRIFLPFCLCCLDLVMNVTFFLGIHDMAALIISLKFRVIYLARGWYEIRFEDLTSFYIRSYLRRSLRSPSVVA